ncbi:MAG: FAD:protein FMN transferase [Planctomycetia bacterium]|jgi:thiamine biosynthesis lipoprotein|nr:FAD:protein FMN transferase [Planctomycetia bacterium]
MQSTPAIGLLLIALPAAVSGEEALQRFSRSQVHMAVDFEIVLHASDAKMADEALTKAMQRIAELDKRLSDYDLESELSKLSATTANRDDHSSPASPVKLSDDLWHVLLTSQDISRAGDGAFDVTIGPLTKLWRRARRWKELPDAEVIAAARAGVGFQFVQLDPVARTAQLLKPNMRLDLGGIAKGYAADEAVKAVVRCGISRVLVRASGDIAAADPPPGERGWRVGIAPLNPDDSPTRFIEIANCGISTSGDARQHLVVNGRRYSHIIDPRTGQPVSGRSSVTIIAPRATLADAIATAASVVGPDHSLSLLRKFDGTDLFMVYEDETGQQRTVESPGMKRFEK